MIACHWSNQPIVFWNYLPIGLVGTIVHIYGQDSAPSQYLVEFSDAEGREAAMATLDRQEFVVLQYEPAVA